MRRYSGWVIACMAVAYGVLTFNRNIVYQTPISIWEDTERKVSSSVRALSNLGVSMAKLGEIKEGLAVLERAVWIRPEIGQYQAIYRNAPIIAKRPAEGIVALKKAVALEPETVSYRYDLANVYSQMDLHAGAEYKRVLSRTPDDEQALDSYGAMLCRMRRIPESLEVLEKLIG